MIKAISLLLISTITISNLFAVEAGDYCIGGKCYSKLKPRKKIKIEKKILKVDDNYELDVSMEIEQQKADGKKSIIVDSGFDDQGEYFENSSYYNVPNELEDIKDTAPKYFCPDKKTLYCADITSTESDCKCV